LPAEIALVVSNVRDAAGLNLAAAAGISTCVVDHKDFADRPAFEVALSQALEEAGVNFVCLAGFMRLLTPTFVDHWYDRLINIHPSLLPSFPGLGTHQRAIDAGVRFTGCTVHYVRTEMDTGPIITQAAVGIRQDDTADTLAARVLEAEHVCYPTALRLIAEGRTQVNGNLVAIDGASSPTVALINPTEN
tara:strand:- start:412 stop:981 length:570 start_codon:yes stop_codon:yes gene_type:complete